MALCIEMGALPDESAQQVVVISLDILNGSRPVGTGRSYQHYDEMSL